MAKKKKNKSGAPDKTEAQAQAQAPASSAASASSAAPVTGNKLVDGAFASGNYAALRHYAKAMPEAQKLIDYTKVDMGQAVVGLIALIVVLAVAIGTLH